MSDDAQAIFLVMFEYARNRKDLGAAKAGRDAPTIPLGFTAASARKLAADLIAAADAMDGPPGATIAPEDLNASNDE